MPASRAHAIIQGIKKTARGFRNAEHFKTAVYFHCGGLDLCPHENPVEPLRREGYLRYCRQLGICDRRAWSEAIWASGPSSARGGPACGCRTGVDGAGRSRSRVMRTCLDTSSSTTWRVEVDINALRVLAPLPRAPVSRSSRPQPRTPQPRWSRRHSSMSEVVRLRGVRTGDRRAAGRTRSGRTRPPLSRDCCRRARGSREHRARPAGSDC